MTPLLFVVALCAELLLVAGQLIIKRAMMMTNRPSLPKTIFTGTFLAGIVALAAYFFLWIGLMQNRNLQLSQQYAFDALAPMLLVLTAAVFLKERLTARAWVGIGLISTGLMLISVTA